MNKQQAINEAIKHTLLSQMKLEFLWDSIEKSPAGDIIEVGCFRGGSSLVIASAANLYKPQSKIYICDTFKGIALSGSKDNHHKDGDFNTTSREHVNDLLKSKNLTNFELIEGIFPHETEHLINTNGISFLHIDVDVYDGYMSILKWAQNKLVPGAVIVFDDYSAWSCRGAKLAVDEYFAGRTDFELFLRKTDIEDRNDAMKTSWARYVS